MIFIGSDHRGYELKEKLKLWFEKLGCQYEDCGATTYDKDDDYPDYAGKVAEKVIADEDNRGILICGSGVGISIAANKIKGIRAGTGFDEKQIVAAVNDEDLNILAISADYLTEEKAKEIVKSFLETKFSEEERHIRRINKITKLEI